MPVGLSRTKEDVDQRVGMLVVNLRNTMTEIDRFSELLATVGPTGLTTLGYSPDDIALLTRVMSDMVHLVAIARGEQTLPEVKDFTQYARLLMGVM